MKRLTVEKVKQLCFQLSTMDMVLAPDESSEDVPYTYQPLSSIREEGFLDSSDFSLTEPVVNCPFMESNSLEYIYIVPIIFVLGTNMFFLIWIMWVSDPKAFKNCADFNFSLKCVRVFSWETSPKSSSAQKFLRFLKAGRIRYPSFSLQMRYSSLENLDTRYMNFVREKKREGSRAREKIRIADH